MFVLKSIGGLIWGNSNSLDLIRIPSATLNIIRFNSLKAPRECILLECSATVKRTPCEFHYQLVVTRIVEEGVEDLEETEEETDEYTFLIDECMKFSKGEHDGLTAFRWAGPSSEDEMFELVCDESITSYTATSFQRVVLECMFQRKYRRTHENASDEELFSLTSPFPPLSLKAPMTPTPASSKSAKLSKPSSPPPKPSLFPGLSTEMSKTLVGVPAPVQDVPSGKTIFNTQAEFYLFDSASKPPVFSLQNPAIQVTIIQTDPFMFWLVLSDGQKKLHCQKIDPNVNPFFDDQHRAFIWNYYFNSERVYSLSLRFVTDGEYFQFKNTQNQCLYEVINQESFSKLKDDEQDYVKRGTYSEDVEMEDADDRQEEEEEEEEEENDEMNSEEEESTDEYESVGGSPDCSSKNTLLDISHLHHRSFVVRGEKIGIFKQTPSSLEFKTTINTPFSPFKTLLHDTDRSMILMDSANRSTLSQLDIETGKIVSDWRIHDTIPVTEIVHDSKFANTSATQTFIGLSDNNIFRIDPRQKDNKLKESEWKSYISKNGFSCGSTNERGELVVGDKKGELRFFNKLGIKAKTNLPGLGDPIQGIDVTANGKYVIATCKTYLLFICTLHPDSTTSAFTKAFPKAEKPPPIRLQLKPHHLALLQCPLDFTPARFNSFPSSNETSIVTSTGPYVITWSLKSIEQGRLYDYSIKKYPERVVMDRFGSSVGGASMAGSSKSSVGGSIKKDTQPIIVALENDVKMIKRGDLKAVEKVVGTPARRNVKGNGIVNSPW